ncbi:MAG: ATP-binding protein [Clostridia bacterium]|nr:ATP-binding protein [Clostridia bacterium]
MNLDDRYEIHFDKVTNKLIIKERKENTAGFWGKNVYSLATLVGKNGEGKSTFVHFILETVVGGRNKPTDQNIVVMMNGKGKIDVYTEKEIEIKSGIPGLPVGTIKNSQYPSIPAFFYGAHFNLPFDGSEIWSSQFGGMYNATEGYRLAQYLVEYSNTFALQYSLPLNNYLQGYYSQNNFEICSFLIDYYDHMEQWGIRPPQYILIVPNKSGETSLDYKKARYHQEIEIPEFSVRPDASKRFKTLAEFTYHIFINAATNEGRIDKSIVKSLRDWIKILKIKVLDENSMISSFGEAFNSFPDIDMVCEILRYIFENCKFYDTGEYVRFYFDMTEDSGILRKLLRYVEAKRVFLTGRIFDMVCSFDPRGNTILSSGEQAMLDLYSRLYDAIVRRPKVSANSDILSPQLIVLDEAEIGFHPEWQRKFINNLTRFLNSIENSESYFQIIVTTHSPIILSDIPLSCTNYLCQENERKPMRETFGANVFDLYRNSFFLKGGMTGEFVLKKIEDILERIEEWNKDNPPSDDELDWDMQIIRHIADNRVSDYIVEELERVDPHRAAKYYEEKIKSLEKRDSHE